MFRISDILKKHKKEPSSAHEKPPPGIKFSEENVKAPSGVVGLPHTGGSPGTFHTSMEKSISTGAKKMISSALDKELAKESEAKAAHLYQDVYKAVEDIYNSDLRRQPGFLGTITALTEKAIDMLTEHNRGIVSICLLGYPEIKHYLYYHATNVFFLSLDMGLEMGYERQHLLELGAGAFLSSIGIRDFDEQILKEGELDKREYEKIREHPNMAASILKRATSDIGAAILQIVRQAHERADGSGYPEGLTADETSEFAQIVGLADVYEALTHRRPYRERYTPIEALDIILKNKSVYGPKIIKALIRRIGVYPVGTLVMLNSKEAGVVVMNRAELPFRPVVSIIYDAYGKEYEEPKEIDLSHNAILFVEDCLKEKVPLAAAGG